MSYEAVVNIDIQGKLPKVASGKVRDLYAIDDSTLLFVASDRISAYDVIMENVSALPKCPVHLSQNRKSQFQKTVEKF
jgi:phosphoribosylaminoimidazole-succinocarboxamide synthase